jgi:hypothetical protein
MITYFIVAEGLSDRVKIGKTKSLAHRITELQCGSPSKLSLWKVIFGDLEKQIHERFSEQRIHGEWFLLNPDLAEFVNSTAVDYEFPKKAQGLKRGCKKSDLSFEQVVSKFALPKDRQDSILNVKRFSRRTIRCLLLAGMNSVNDVSAKTETQMMEVRGVGESILEELRPFLKNESHSRVSCGHCGCVFSPDLLSKTVDFSSATC